MLKETLVVLASLSAVVAFADNGPLLSSGGDSYQILENAFNSAQKAQLSDIPLLADIARSKPSMNCVESTGPTLVGSATNQPMNLAAVWFGRVNGYVTDPGTPGSGPLFPGTPATTASVVPLAFNPEIDSSDLGYSNSEWAQLLSDPEGGVQITMSTTAEGDLQSVSTERDSSNTGYGITYTDTFRKSGSLVFFHEVVVALNSNPTTGDDAYGYCYPANEN